MCNLHQSILQHFITSKGNRTCILIERLNIVKMLILPKMTYRFISIPIKIPMVIFAEREKYPLKFIWNFKVPWMAEVILTKNKLGGLILPYFKTYYKGTAMKTVWYWHEDRQTEQWNTIKSPSVHHHIYGQIIFHKGAKTIQWGKGSFFIKWYWANWIFTQKRIHLNT